MTNHRKKKKKEKRLKPLLDLILRMTLILIKRAKLWYLNYEVTNASNTLFYCEQCS
jgi:hypothetical protein